MSNWNLADWLCVSITGALIFAAGRAYQIIVIVRRHFANQDREREREPR